MREESASECYSLTDLNKASCRKVVWPSPKWGAGGDINRKGHGETLGPARETALTREAGFLFPGQILEERGARFSEHFVCGEGGHMSHFPQDGPPLAPVSLVSLLIGSSFALKSILKGELFLRLNCGGNVFVGVADCGSVGRKVIPSQLLFWHHPLRGPGK